ncbi:hypothetical protein PIB30_065440 [Stylosanthes scabra]|uniref:Uncharacterized protein n=1 Tax=Stylosanthes scabra TaxID=79078 RepID=A0ABU6UPY7_9FABA|nr:hypothetical protein [Stylosanthes scabra]
MYESWQQRAAKRLRELFHEIRKKGAPPGWILEDIFGHEVSTRTHTRKKDREWVDKRSHDCKEAFEAERNRPEAKWRAIIDAGGLESPPIDDEAIWLRIAGGCMKGRIYAYGKGVVPAYSVPLII